MSVEAYVIAALVDEGSPKKAFQQGVTSDDFEFHDEEFDWIVDRAGQRKPINPRLFKKQFPEFDFIRNKKESTFDLIDELKSERTYLTISSAIEQIIAGEAPLDQENSIEKALELRELLGDALKIHAPQSDVLIKGNWQDHFEHMKQLSILRESGQIPGIPTGLGHFDHHFGGLQGEASYVFLGRPGDAKSFTLAKLAIEGAWFGARVGFFSPEMSEHQHRCRFNTLLSAKKEIQIACGLSGAFRNRALKDGRGFNLKKYKKFLDYVDNEMPGEIVLFTQKYRRKKMSVAFIESRIEDLGLDMIVVDPIYKLKSIRPRGNRWEELGEITDSLTDLAHGFNIPVVLSNQAGRANQGTKGDAPGKDSSYGSDAPVQEGDCVIGVKHESENRMMKYKCSKNRHGESFNFAARFVPNVGILEDVTQIQGDYLNGYDPEKAAELGEALKEMELDVSPS